ncbi:helix-turn-helix transcriptional regulator [Kitasatospora sp. Ki12]
MPKGIGETLRETEEVAQLLRELKSRSGLSYGALAKRLHLSTSALHRYCNGDVMPTEFAPLERLSQLCEATPEERVELYRLWVVARAVRGSKPAAAPETPEPAAATPAPDRAPGVAPRRRARRWGALAAATAIAVLAAVGIVVIGLKTDQAGADSARAADVRPSAGAPSPSLSASRSPSVSAAAAGASPSGTAAGADPSISAPVTVSVHPSGWGSQCDQYLVDRPPSEVPWPPAVPDVAGWVSQVGAVPGHYQSVKLTVQGTGREPVLLTGINVRVTRVAAPLAWNVYAVGEGCGGGIGLHAYDVDLDAAHPVPVVSDGSTGLPLRVSESDPVVIAVDAETTSHDVSWYLELEWTTGTRKGTVTADPGHGTPFRTSAVKGRPLYVYPNGGTAWEPRVPRG